MIRIFSGFLGWDPFLRSFSQVPKKRKREETKEVGEGETVSPLGGNATAVKPEPTRVGGSVAGRRQVPHWTTGTFLDCQGKVGGEKALRKSGVKERLYKLLELLVFFFFLASASLNSSCLSVHNKHHGSP